MEAVHEALLPLTPFDGLDVDGLADCLPVDRPLVPCDQPTCPFGCTFVLARVPCSIVLLEVCSQHIRSVAAAGTRGEKGARRIAMRSNPRLPALCQCAGRDGSHAAQYSASST